MVVLEEVANCVPVLTPLVAEYYGAGLAYVLVRIDTG